MEKLADIEGSKREAESKKEAEGKRNLIRNPERHHVFEGYEPVTIRTCLKYFGQGWDQSFKKRMKEAVESKSCK